MVIMATEGTKPATGAAHLLNKFKIHCERKSKLLPARHSKSALGLHGVKVQATKFRWFIRMPCSWSPATIYCTTV